MYGKRCNAVIWNDNYNPARGLVKRTRFVASYIMDDGFPSMEECQASLSHPDLWAYFCFCGHWYAIHADSYYQEVLVSKEAVYISKFYQNGGSIREKHHPDYNVSEYIVKKHNAGPRKWTDGIYQDLLRIDPELQVLMSNGKPYRGKANLVNTVIIFGTFFFVTDICIRTDNYVRHVFYHYFNERSMDFNWRKIEIFRSQDQEYWNPFSNHTAKDSKDMQKQKRMREKGISMGEIIENREFIGNTKVMDDSDAFADNQAAGIYHGNFSYRRFH